MKKPRKSVLIVVGLPGSGKTTASDVAKKFGFRVLSFGDIIRDEVRARGLVQNEQNVERVANWFHSGREALLVHRLEKKLRGIRTAKPFYVLEGSRSPKQLSELKKRFTIKMLAVVLPRRLRWHRQLARHRSDIRTLADARERDERELSYGVASVMRGADWRISSNCSKNEFYRRCERFFRGLLK